MPPSAVNPIRLRNATSKLVTACNAFLKYQEEISSAAETPPRAEGASHSEDLSRVEKSYDTDEVPATELVSASALQHLADLVRVFLELDSVVRAPPFLGDLLIETDF
jgi:hypothetical protein